jgi:hypothetical protein
VASNTAASSEAGRPPRGVDISRRSARTTSSATGLGSVSKGGFVAGALLLMDFRISFFYLTGVAL